MKVIALSKHRSPRFWIAATVIAVALLLVGILGLRVWYNQSLSPVSSSHQVVYFTVTPGSGLHQIATKLKEVNLIRNVGAFETYVRSNELHAELQAGTYSLNQSMGAREIVKKMVDGDVTKNLLTILPGKRLDQIKSAFKAAGYSSTEVNTAFNPDLYRDHPVLSYLPRGKSLEGFLYPDSFQKQADTPAETIVRESLDEMKKYLTADVIDGFAARGLSVYKGISLASIVYRETDDPVYQPRVAQVFLSRLKRDMNLGSDVTAYYAAAIAGKGETLGVDSPYNTRLNKGLPPGPISNMTYSALQAVAKPAKTDYLYFVAGDDDKIYFTHTHEQHQEAVRKYCHEKCS